MFSVFVYTKLGEMVLPHQVLGGGIVGRLLLFSVCSEAILSDADVACGPIACTFGYTEEGAWTLGVRFLK